MELLELTWYHFKDSAFVLPLFWFVMLVIYEGSNLREHSTLWVSIQYSDGWILVKLFGVIAIIFSFFMALNDI